MSAHGQLQRPDLITSITSMSSLLLKAYLIDNQSLDDELSTLAAASSQIHPRLHKSSYLYARLFCDCMLFLACHCRGVASKDACNQTHHLTVSSYVYGNEYEKRQGDATSMKMSVSTPQVRNAFRRELYNAKDIPP